MHRDQVKARTRRAQLTAAALAGLAVAVVAVPAGMLGGGSESGAVVAGADAGKPVSTPVAKAPEAPALADPVNLAAALDKLGQAPAIPVKPTVAANPAGEAPVQVAPPPAPWRFIGVVMGQTRLGNRAIVTVHEQQTMVREGQKVDQDRVDEIHDTFLLVTGPDNTQRRIDMEIAQRPTLTVAAPAPVAVATAEAMGHEHVLSPEEIIEQARAAGADDATIERMKADLARGLDPRQFTDQSSARGANITPRQQAQMLSVGGGRAGRGGRGGPELDVFSKLQRERVQQLDDAFRNGTINADQYKKRQRELQNLPGTKDGEGDPDAAQRELDALQNGEVNALGQPTGATSEPKPK